MKVNSDRLYKLSSVQKMAHCTESVIWNSISEFQIKLNFGIESIDKGKLL